MSADPSRPPTAYLATRGGAGWRDLYRLDPATSTTVGRATDCRVTLADERASRRHAEVFVPTAGTNAGRWHIRDLESRNGTAVNGEAVSPDAPRPLAEGDELTVGESCLIFTHDPAAPLPEEEDGLEGETRGGTLPASGGGGAGEEPKILDRRRETRLSGRAPDGPLAGERRAATLYRLALALGSATDATAAGEAALDVLLEHTPADIAAVLLLVGEEPAADAEAEDPDAHRRAARTVRRLSLVAHRARTDGPYRLVSESLSRAVLAGGEAVLAEDVGDDDRLAGRDSLGQLRAESLICAPLRPASEVTLGRSPEQEASGRIAGLVHLYSSDPGNPLDSGDLDFTLAVADQLALALANLRDRDVLAHDREELAKRTESLAAGLSKAERVNATLRRSLLDGDGEMIGESGPTAALREDVRRIAPTDATVLVRGESGVGKELVARALHRHSRRSAGPLVTMNCAALSESLLESELFGHEKGAFTGATAKTVGKFEAADGGTLFLDEVGEMSPAIQAKFLRALEGHAFERVGGRESIRCDVRVVAATNRDLETAVEKGAFRQDLYYRLHVVVLNVEPLRNRLKDVPVLADHFLKVSAARTGRSVEGFSAAAEELLSDYRWPGNVRELRNAVERAVVLCRGEQVEPEDLRLTTFESPTAPDSGDDSTGVSNKRSGYRSISLEVLEREHVLATLTHTGWNKSRAASILGIERSTLDRKLKKYGVERPGADA